MMARTTSMIALLLALSSLATALKVTPGSPCASFCTDSGSGTSSTTGKEIACEDDDFSSKDAGQKFQRCVSCLLDSTYVSGGESDQEWFVYNVRFAFDYCVFGYPNATDVGSTPCMIDEACGPLKTDLTVGIPDPAQTEQYDYCGGDASALVGEARDDCLQCVRIGGQHNYISNFLTALEAGCSQQPAAGKVLGLNETVFSHTAVEIVNPNAPIDADPASDGPLSVDAIAGVAVGGFAFCLLAAGCVFMQLRKRRNRAARAARRSDLSFRCMTRMSPPRTPRSADGDEAALIGRAVADEKPYLDPAAALSSNPVAAQPYHANLAGITTTTGVPAPPAVHPSPQRSSPVDAYTTPTSTTSVRSNAPLLSHHHHQHTSPLQHSVSAFGTGVAVSTPSAGSPYTDQQGFRAEPAWGASEQRQPARNLVGKKGAAAASSVAGRPVEVGRIQTNFPPPPRR